MHPSRPIPRKLFLGYLFVTLALITGLWLSWLLQGIPPYAWLQQTLAFLGQRESEVLGATLAYFGLFLLWLVPTFALRHFSDMPPLMSQKNAPRNLHELATQFHHDVADQRALHNQMLQQPDYEPARYDYFRWMGRIGIGVGLLGFLVAWLGWYLSGEVWLWAFLFGVIGVLGGLYSMATGRPGILDVSKLHPLQKLSRRVLIALLIFILIFLPVMCVLTSAGII